MAKFKIGAVEFVGVPHSERPGFIYCETGDGQNSMSLTLAQWHSMYAASESLADLVALRAEVLVLRHLVKRIDETLRVPAAEYVPAIGDVFTLIDALAATKDLP